MFSDAPVFENIAHYIPWFSYISIFHYRLIFPFFDKVEAVHVNARGMKTEFDFSWIDLRGLWIPSKMLLRMPGPSRSDRGEPERATSSSMVKPDVSS